MNSRLFRFSVMLVLAAGMTGGAVLIASRTTPARPLESPASLASSAASGGNLLINPDFENGYSYPLPCCNNIAVPAGWNIRWYTNTAAVIDGTTYAFKQPEVKIIDNTKWPFCDGCAPNVPPRIHSGRYAVDSFALFAPQDTTLYQQVGRLPLGAIVTGSAWLHAWVGSCNPFPRNATVQVPAVSLQGPNDSDNDYQCADNFWPWETAHMMVGIDPWGGTDPRAASVVWNWDQDNPAWWGPYDDYSPTLPVTATARSYTVTLFLRGVTQQPTRYDDLYFDTASLTYSFPLQWQTAQGPEWPLSTSITIGLQAPLSLTQVSAALQDPIGNPVAITSLGSSATAPYTLAWRFIPAAEGPYRFTVAAHELPDPLVQSIAVQTLPFHYRQDHALASGAISEAALITYVLSSPVTLTHLTWSVIAPPAMPLTATLVSSSFDLGRYNFVWQFAANSSGWHTVTLHADEFMAPFTRRILLFASRLFLPIVLRG